MTSLARRLTRRLVRLWRQSRIRLPRPPLSPEEIGAGARLQIGQAAWRVRGRLLLESGAWMFRLEGVGETLEARPARLLVPAGQGAWRLVRDGREMPLPPEAVVVFATSGFDKTGSTV